MNNSFKSKKRTTSGRYFYDRDRFWLIVIIIFSAVYIFFAFINKATRDFSFDSIRNRLTTLFAIISAIAFWLQFKKTERLNESNYVKDLNNQFVNNKNMTKIEHELELYFNQYTEIKKQLKRAKKEDVSLTVDYISQIHLGINLSRTDLD
ncbi:MAG: hypothetical protein J6V14_09165, partial [Clostridia bacterium]|nr:hypothetical protein [Clostridia bacterium]